MKRAEKILKNFAKPYLEVLEQARVMYAFFMVDIGSFTARFPFMDSTYAADFLTAIDDADAQPDDETVVDMQQMVTEQLNQNMQLARNAYTTLMVYVELAFPGRADVLELFGKRKYEAARRNQLKLKELMELAYTVAQKPEYNPALIAKGYTQAEIDQLNVIAETLEVSNVEQEVAKGERLTSSQLRVKKYNEMYAYMQEISKTSKLVFADDYAKQQQYLLYNDGSGLNVLATYENTVAANAPVAAGPLVANTQKLRLTLVSGENLEFGLSASANGAFDGNTVTLGAPEVLVVDIDDFATAATNIVVRNQSLTLEGSFKVECLG